MDKARPWQRNKFYKTRLCPYHFKKGSVCKEGEFCSYAHSFSDLRTSVDLTKTKLCNDYAMGTCLRPVDLCPFAHGPADLREPVIPSAPVMDQTTSTSGPSSVSDSGRGIIVSQLRQDDDELVGHEAINQALELLRLMTIKEQKSSLSPGGAFDIQDASTNDESAEYCASSRPMSPPHY